LRLALGSILAVPAQAMADDCDYLVVAALVLAVQVPAFRQCVPGHGDGGRFGGAINCHM
jgi:hypothetical protein